MAYSRVRLTWKSFSNANNSDGWNSVEICIENSRYHTYYRPRLANLVRTIAFSVVTASRLLYSGTRRVYVGIQTLTARWSIFCQHSHCSQRRVKSRTVKKCYNITYMTCAVTIIRVPGTVQKFSVRRTSLRIQYSRNEHFSFTVNSAPSASYLQF